MTDNGTLTGDKSCSDERLLVRRAPAACLSSLLVGTYLCRVLSRRRRINSSGRNLTAFSVNALFIRVYTDTIKRARGAQTKPFGDCADPGAEGRVELEKARNAA